MVKVSGLIPLIDARAHSCGKEVEIVNVEAQKKKDKKKDKKKRIEESHQIQDSLVDPEEVHIPLVFAAAHPPLTLSILAEKGIKA